MARATERLKASGMATLIEEACTTVRTRLRRRGAAHRQPIEKVLHPEELPENWETLWVEKAKTEAAWSANPAVIQRILHRKWVRKEVLGRWKK
ncbi:hypothetical protein EMCG_06520 [[Emmonsia] crescens]|uniref:Uncharacterized protein n=1 Tax=[Emmonsia] crescens TaxID=73230 RepID=A0A0G2IBB3_9EURO|nr:hypothetical protein EMCG_06520 [Emmonsia crescens UAMH 3008]